MGNYKFRLSDMIPNAWFYKLRDMTNVRNHNHHRYSATTTKRKHLLPPPNTTTSSDYHYKYNPPANPKALDTHFLEPPKKSSSHPPNGTRTTIRNSIYYKQQSPKTITSSNNSNCICGRRASPQLSSGLETELTRTHDSFAQPPSPVTNILDDADDGDHDYFSCRVSDSANDIIIDMNQSFSTKIQNQEDGYGTISELDQLPSVLTRVPVRVAETDSKFVDHHEPSESFLNHRKVKTISVTQKQSTNGVKLRSNTPRVLGGNGGGGRRSVSKKRRNKEKKESIKGTGGCSVAIVKSSLDPQSDFMESMMEMIVETNIRGPNALEELLACYLSLNSAEYHPLIVNAFHHIWLHFPHLHK